MSAKVIHLEIKRLTQIVSGLVSIYVSNHSSSIYCLESGYSLPKDAVDRLFLLSSNRPMKYKKKSNTAHLVCVRHVLILLKYHYIEYFALSTVAQ